MFPQETCPEFMADLSLPYCLNYASRDIDWKAEIRTLYRPWFWVDMMNAVSSAIKPLCTLSAQFTSAIYILHMGKFLRIC